MLWFSDEIKSIDGKRLTAAGHSERASESSACAQHALELEPRRPRHGEVAGDETEAQAEPGVN